MGDCPLTWLTHKSNPHPLQVRGGRPHGQAVPDARRVRAGPLPPIKHSTHAAPPRGLRAFPWRRLPAARFPASIAAAPPRHRSGEGRGADQALRGAGGGEPPPAGAEGARGAAGVGQALRAAEVRGPNAWRSFLSSTRELCQSVSRRGSLLCAHLTPASTPRVAQPPEGHPDRDRAGERDKRPAHANEEAGADRGASAKARETSPAAPTYAMHARDVCSLLAARSLLPLPVRNSSAVARFRRPPPPAAAAGGERSGDAGK